MQKVKQGLITNAKVKSSYAKVKKREKQEAAVHNHSATIDRGEAPPIEPATLEPHPDRVAIIESTPSRDMQRMIDGPEAPSDQHSPRHRVRRRPEPFAREAFLADRRKQEADSRNRDIQAARAERELSRRRMAKARETGRNGQRKLGRESKILLERVKKMMA